MRKLIDNLRLGNFKRIYYFYGKDTVSTKTLVDVAVGSIVPSGDTFNLYKLDGKNFDINELMDVAESCPMFADYKCITIHDFNCDTVPADTIKELLSRLDSVPNSSIIIFYVTSFDVKNGTKYPTAKNKKLIDYVTKNGEVFEAVQKTLPQASKEIQQVCKDNHTNISYDAAQLVANKCLCDSLTIQNELKKLIDYANGNDITSQMVESVVSDYYNVDAFAFAKAVVSMNGQLSIKILHELFALRAEPIAILGAVSKSFIDLYRVKTALANGRGERDILSDFDYTRREFVVRNYIRDEHRIRIEHVRDCIRILAKTNVDLVSYGIDGKILLEKAVAEMINSGYKYY